MDKVEIINLLAFIGFYWWIALMLLTFLWAVCELWRRYIKPCVYGIMHDDDSIIVQESGPGDPTEIADAEYRGWKPRGGR